MEMILIKQDSQEWEKMWDNLASHPLNEGYEEPSLVVNEEEAWQYIGSYRSNNKVVHEFRHKKHPRFGRKEYIKFAASDTMTDEDIERVIQVK